MNEFILNKKKAKVLFESFTDELQDDDTVYISKVLQGNMKASKSEKKYMEVGYGVNPQLFKDKGKSIHGLLNSQMFLVVVPNKKFINPKIGENK